MAVGKQISYLNDVAVLSQHKQEHAIGCRPGIIKWVRNPIVELEWRPILTRLCLIGAGTIIQTQQNYLTHFLQNQNFRLSSGIF